MVAQRFAHLLFAIGAGEESGDEDDLGFLACLPLKVASDKIVEKLVIPAEFDIRFYGDRIVALENGVLKFGQADWDTFLVTFREVVPFEHSGNIDLSIETEEIGTGEFCQPFAISTDFRLLWVDDFEDLVGIGFCILLDDFGFEGGTGFRAASGVADTGGVVTDDDDGEMAGFLKLADLSENESVAEVKIGGGRIESEFHSEGSTGGEFLGELLAGMDVGETGEEGFEGHPVRITNLGWR